MTKTREPESAASEMVWVEDGPAMSSPEVGTTEVTIGELATSFGVTLRTLRFYEKRGLLKPRRRGTARLYDSQDRERLALILQGKRLGFTLTEIRALVAPAKEGADSRALDLSREKCVEQIKLLERKRREIETALTELRRIYSSFYLQRAASDLS
jgi:DNA-binding transcriptional MerR regulator